MDTSFEAQASPSGELIVVDHNQTNLHVMGRRLSRLGYAVALVDNGPAALDFVQARHFDLMIVDMALPVMSGTAVVRELRGTAGLADLPVIMITGRSDPGAAVDAMNAGADDHLVKPFDFDGLGARIERMLARSRAVERLRRSNAALDARIATRAAELGELRTALSEAEKGRRELAAQYEALSQTRWVG